MWRCLQFNDFRLDGCGELIRLVIEHACIQDRLQPFGGQFAVPVDVVHWPDVGASKQLDDVSRGADLFVMLFHIELERLFDPLAMHHTSYTWDAEYDRLAARGYWIDGRATESDRPEEARAGASLRTTVADFSKFLCAMVAREPIHPSCLQPRTLATMLTPHTDYDDALRWGL